MSKADNVAIGARVREAREASGYSRPELAAMLNDAGIALQEQTIKRIEDGARELKAFELFELAGLFGIDPRSLSQYEKLDRDLDPEIEAARRAVGLLRQKTRSLDDAIHGWLRSRNESSRAISDARGSTVLPEVIDEITADRNQLVAQAKRMLTEGRDQA